MMKKILFALIFILISFKAEAENFQIIFQESNFFEEYKVFVFINNYQYIRLKKVRQPKDSNYEVEDIVYEKINSTKKKEIISRLISLGVGSWKNQYKVKTKKNVYTLCDGSIFNLEINSDELKKSVIGVCAFPENYDNVIREILGNSG